MPGRNDRNILILNAKKQRDDIECNNTISQLNEDDKRQILLGVIMESQADCILLQECKLIDVTIIANCSPYFASYLSNETSILLSPMVQPFVNNQYQNHLKNEFSIPLLERFTEQIRKHSINEFVRRTVRAEFNGELLSAIGRIHDWLKLFNKAHKNYYKHLMSFNKGQGDKLDMEEHIKEILSYTNTLTEVDLLSQDAMYILKVFRNIQNSMNLLTSDEICDYFFDYIKYICQNRLLIGNIKIDDNIVFIGSFHGPHVDYSMSEEVRALVSAIISSALSRAYKYWIVGGNFNVFFQKIRNIASKIGLNDPRESIHATANEVLASNKDAYITTGSKELSVFFLHSPFIEINNLVTKDTVTDVIEHNPLLANITLVKTLVKKKRHKEVKKCECCKIQ